MGESLPYRTYRSTFSTEPYQWKEVFIPFPSFVPSYRGNQLSGPPLDLASIRRIAILIADGKSGPFSLVVDWIQLD